MAYHLAIDVGNSRSKFGLFEGRELLDFQIFSNKDLTQLEELYSKYDLHSGIISSVNNVAEQKIVKQMHATKLIQLSHKTPLPVTLKYDTPETLGRDRIAGVIGAMIQFENQNVLVIDAGTCITYDFLTQKKVYLGGAISPGIQMRFKALNTFTNKLPEIKWTEGVRPKSLGNSTVTSMLSGVINGVISEIEGFIDSYGKQYNHVKIVLTGGDAIFFEKEVKNGIFADPNLVLKGLNEILLYNRD